MAWRCDACTFENRVGSATKCAICETTREYPPMQAIASVQPKSLALSNDEVDTQTTKVLHKANPTPLRETTKTQQHNTIEKFQNPNVKKSIQSTLFGGVAPKGEERPKGRKRKTKDATHFTLNAKHQSLCLPTGTNTAAASRLTSDDTIEVLAKRTKKIMKEVFGIRKLRHLQPKSIECFLRRQSHIVVMATGGGKSLCYQLPALVLGGTTIVVSPLIALMNDQVKALCDKGIAAAVISSSIEDRDNTDTMERLLGRNLQAQQAISGKIVRYPPIVLLYCTPEQIQTGRFRSILKELHQGKRLTGFAIDEAHCLSSWGHDFRPAYRSLGYLRDTFPDIPCIACTATATSKVIVDIQETLRMRSAPLYLGSFDRKNIFYKVRYRDALNATNSVGAIKDLVAFIKKQHTKAKENNSPCSGIIYVHKREETMNLATTIASYTGLRVEGYHGAMKAADRTRIQQAWTSGEVQIAIATVAFGMGIDLAHVRYVVHWSMAKTVEGFYQESGRAGRDGLAAYSLLYFSKDDANKFKFLITQMSAKNEKKESMNRKLDALQKMVDYCISPGCRRAFLLRYFGAKETETKTVCMKTCDYCCSPRKVGLAMEAAGESKLFSSQTRPFGKHAMWNGQWEHAHGDETVSTEDSDKNDDGLRITEAASFEDDQDCSHLQIPRASDFRRASSILSRFEAIECQQDKRNGFVRFKSVDGKHEKGGKHAVIIPQHFRRVVTNPSRSVVSEDLKEDSARSSSDFACDAQRLIAQLAQAQAKQAALISGTKFNETRAVPPPPPPIPITTKKTKSIAVGKNDT
jgi:ATP-dependent DNA helicase RecQ